MSSQNEYDLIVIGAGPAGSVVAKEAASRGFRTLLLEKRPQVGIPVRCGEATGSRQWLSTFGEVDESTIESEINGVVLYGARGTKVVYRKPQLGLVLDREKFDPWLAQLAVSAGAELRTNARASAVGAVVNDTRSVVIVEPSGEWEARAGVVVAADGAESLVGRWAGIKTVQQPPHTCSAVELRIDLLIPETDSLLLWQGRDTINDGYIWAFPKVKSKTTNFGAGFLVPKWGEPDIRTVAEGWLKRLYPEAKVLEVFGGSVPVSGSLEQTVAERFLIVGDAAHHTNPLTGGGIAAAMSSGRLAAERIAEGFAKGDLSEKFLSHYASRCWSLFGAEHERNRRLRNHLISLSLDEQSRFYRLLQRALARGKFSALLSDPLMAIQVARKIRSVQRDVALIER